MNYHHILPGSLEVYCGPMKSGKTREILYKIDKIKYIENCNFKFIKPKIDIRDTVIKSRFSEITENCEIVDETDPHKILEHINSDLDLLIIDEIQFFSKEIVDVIETILKKGIHVVVAGLDTDFSGVGFGQVPQLMTLATKVHKLTGICEFPGCTSSSIRTQRLINGKPVKRTDPVIAIEGQNNTYESRCLTHHQIDN
jgi:thymidine kinase